MVPFFFYGSLRDAELLGIVLNRDPASLDIAPARAPGCAAEVMAGEAYPVLVEAAGSEAEGVLVRGLTESDMARLVYFEEAEYGTAELEVLTDAGVEPALYFRGTEKRKSSGEVWDYGTWLREERPIAHFAARELMTFFGRLPIEQVDDVWPGIMNRARAHARASREPMPVGAPRSSLARDDVRILERSQPWAGYFSVESCRLQHRTFSGEWSQEVSRATFQSGDAVTVLPYDPRTDRVLLIEQFRAAAHIRGDLRPWCIEPVAGRIDGSGTAEDIARREALEEAGLTLGRVERIGEYYSSPGISGEVLISYCGEADLSDAGGVHGLAEEGEDIRSVVLGFEEALAATASGHVNTAPAILSLHWLAFHRERLREAWG